MIDLLMREERVSVSVSVSGFLFPFFVLDMASG